MPRPFHVGVKSSEALHGSITHRSTDAGKVVEIRLSEKSKWPRPRRIADVGVYALPAFLMFYRGGLVYAGQLGGEKIRVASEFKPYKMLYVEPTFMDMIWARSCCGSCGSPASS